MLKTKILECLSKMETHDLISLHNEYRQAVNGFDDMIYSMDDLDMLCEGQDAHWIACRVYYGDFNPNDDFVMFTGYGNFRSLNDYNVTDYIYEEEIADYIIEHEESFYNDDIQDILDEYEETAVMENA